MKLYLFPESASLSNGYGIAINSDYKRLNPQANDMIVWYTNEKEFPFLDKKNVIIKRPERICLKRIKNVLTYRASCEVTYNELLFLKSFEFDEIFCGDVIFYRALRKMFPDKHIIVRFHNCYSRIYDRKKLLNISVSLKFYVDLRIFYLLEREIFNDRNVYKIFITQEDYDYYTSMTGFSSDADIWSFNPDNKNIEIEKPQYQLDYKLVWLGGVEAHKKDSIDWFINDVFFKLKEDFPTMEFHLWGRETEQFNNPSANIFGHGFYNDSGLPLKNKSLYINPDIIGGGIKIKLLTYFKEGVPFISTPFGFEGYSRKLIDNKYCFITETDKWVVTIKRLFGK